MIPTCVNQTDWPRWIPSERAVLCFIVRDGQVLLIWKKRGLGAGKVNAPGGRIEPGESPFAAAIRETGEEVGLVPHNPQPRGELFFQFMDGYRLHCIVFLADGCDGTPTETGEALPFWAPVDAVPYGDMWADDLLWLPRLLAGETFRGYFVFDNDRMLSHRLESPAVLSAGCSLLLAGCGFTGLAVARLAHARGWKVTALTRSPDSAERLSAEPFRVVACDINNESALAALGSFDAVVDCVSSGGGGVDEYRRVYLDGARTLLRAMRPPRFVFTSSTSVYAQMDGSPVTEESAAEPDRETGRILRETEETALAAGGHVLRLAGLYGPGRWALLENFQAGRATLEDDGARWLNHLHRDDAAEAVLRMLAPGTPEGIYNVADDTPVTQREAYALFAERFALPFPPSGPVNPARKRGWTSKRVLNAKLRATGWEPRYPSIRDALVRDGWATSSPEAPGSPQSK